MKDREQRGKDIVKVGDAPVYVRSLNYLVLRNRYFWMLIVITAVVGRRALEIAKTSLRAYSLKCLIRGPCPCAIYWILIVTAYVVVDSAVLVEPHDCEENEDVYKEGANVCEIGQRMDQGLNKFFHAWDHVYALQRPENSDYSERLESDRAHH